MKRVPLHWDVLRQSSVPIPRKPAWLVTGLWENRDLFFLHNSLIALMAQWDEIFGKETTCPVTFSAEELELHSKEEEHIDGVENMLWLFQNQGVLPADGMIHPESNQTAIENCRTYGEAFLNTARTEGEVNLNAKLRPYPEGLE